MHFEEEAVGAEGFGGLRHGGYEFAVAPRLAACGAGTLHRMGAVHHHGRGDAQHVRNIAEIDDEVVVAVNIAALGEPYLRSARIAGLFVGIEHVGARQELRLLDIHRPARLRGSDQQVGLAAEERGNLDHVDHFAHGRGLPRFMDVGQQLQPPLRAHVGEHPKPLFESGAAERRDRGAVGLVERRLEDDVRAESFVDRHKTLRHGVEQFGRLDDARSGDKFDLHKIRL